ncbi:MAG: hypothetical protein NC340_07800 [Ruminococcus flavefaciens]|nr:hypothetical protein [Ruminococcus flavefaciens]MCM1228684.1 hypothetical protein [Ruminococcus flavefaciens]
MERILCMSAGAVIALCTLVYLVKLLVLWLTGLKINAEIIKSREVKQGSYVHTLRFDFNGRTVEKDDRTGYSQPFAKGEIHKIVCSKKSPDKFEYADALRKNMIVATVLLVMSLLIVVRFAFFVTE